MIWLKAILDLIIIVITFSIPIIFIWSIYKWVQTLGHNKAPIKFKEFLQSYKDKPDKWSLDYWGSSNPILHTPREYIYCKFNYIDYCKYCVWKWNEDRRSKKEYSRHQRDKFTAILNDELRKTPAVIIEDPTPDKSITKHIITHLKDTFGEDKVKVNKENHDETSI